MSKYRNVKTVVDGVTFASKREAARYGELKLLERAGEIANLELQRKFVIVVHGHTICRYIADFVYHDNKTGKMVCEDVKGFKTAVYSLKRKLMKAVLGVDILET